MDGAVLTNAADQWMEDLGKVCTEGIDLSKDESWTPTFSPYHGRVVPMWKITQMARIRMVAGKPPE